MGELRKIRFTNGENQFLARVLDIIEKNYEYNDQTKIFTLRPNCMENYSYQEGDFNNCCSVIQKLKESDPGRPASKYIRWMFPKKYRGRK